MNDELSSGVRAETRALDRRGDSLADVLERVLDKGIVIAGDIRVDLLDIELLTIRIRLLICSADKAAEMGIAWWREDPWYGGQPAVEAGNGESDAIGQRLDELLGATEQLTQRIRDLEIAASREPEPKRSRRRPTKGGET